MALVGATVFAGAPVASAAATTQTQIRSVNADVALTGSLLNVPYNLFADLANVPANENDALNFAARSLMFSGPWFVVSNSNLWGVDPGDPSHFQAVVNFMLPFPVLSGMNNFNNYAEAQGYGGQLWHLAAAFLPVNAQCDTDSCVPTVPVSPITGVAGIDSLLWYGLIATGGQEFPLIYNWFSLKAFQGVLGAGYTYDTEPGITDPSGKVYDGMGFLGTTGPDNLMPWAGTTFKLEPLKPIVQYVQHLLNDTPATNPIKLPSLLQLARNLQALTAASVIAYDPFTPGSPYCKGECKWVKTLKIDYPDLVGYISKAWPGNPLLDGDPDPTKKGEPGEGWLTLYKNGQANVPTEEQIARSIELLQPKESFWDFQNPLPPTGTTVFDTVATAQAWHDFWTSIGFKVPDCNCTPVDENWGSDSTLAASAAATPPEDTTQNAGATVTETSSAKNTESIPDTSSAGSGNEASGSETTSGGHSKLRGWYPGKNLGLKLRRDKVSSDDTGSDSDSESGSGSGSDSGNSSGSGNDSGNSSGSGNDSGNSSGSGNDSGSGNGSASGSGSGSGSGNDSGSGSGSGGSGSGGSGGGNGSD